MHTCPAANGPVPHVGGPISGVGCPTVLIGGLPAARVTDFATFVGPPDPIIKALLKAGADPNGAPARAPIHEAVKVYDLTVARLLLQAGASPEGTLGEEPALYETALLGATEAADLLLKAGSKIDRRDEIGNSACLVAAAAEQWTMVNFLIERGASIWTIGTSGVTVGGFAAGSRLLPESAEGMQLAVVVAKLKAADFPYPPPKARDIRTMVALKQWPPKPQ